MIRNKIIAQKEEIKNRSAEQYIERKVDPKKFEGNLIKVVIGPRRAGKSFLAIHIMNKLGNFGYANFDDEELIEVKQYDDIVKEVDSIYGKPKNLFFDEIQNLPKWELFANRLQRGGYNLVLTGSNSKLLSQELATHLTGRHVLIHIFPFSFKEYISVENRELTQAEIKAKLSRYLVDGGYPEPLLKKLDYKDYLSTLFDSIIYKGIVRRFNIRVPRKIEDLSLQLISNTAKEFSYRSLSNAGKNKSTYTVQKYIGYLEETFLFFEVSRFSYKVKEQASFNKKIYCIDNGFIQAKAFNFSENFGRLYENAVAIHLKQNELRGESKLFYWKNAEQEEVDFVVQKGLKVAQLIQVCHNLNDQKTKDREIRAILKAGKELKCDNLIVLTEDYESEEGEEWFGIKGRIKYIPLWKFLLNE
ncbi:ATP-binding protein [Candidatus Woesearchaeota archaeon]|nr:ATP-binding protein [Candidatus Woesearchaeota archaeon]